MIRKLTYEELEKAYSQASRKLEAYKEISTTLIEENATLRGEIKDLTNMANLGKDALARIDRFKESVYEATDGGNGLPEFTTRIDPELGIRTTALIADDEDETSCDTETEQDNPQGPFYIQEIDPEASYQVIRFDGDTDTIMSEHETWKDAADEMDRLNKQWYEMRPSGSMKVKSTPRSHYSLLA